MQERKITVNDDTYETLKIFRMIFNNMSRKGSVSDDIIIKAAFNALGEKMYSAIKIELKDAGKEDRYL